MRSSSLVVLLVTAAVLYFAREVLIPFALAILLAFLLAPAVRRLERWKLGRVASTLAVVVAGFSLIGAVAWIAGNQAVSLAEKLPEYRANISEKIRYLKTPGQGRLSRAAEAIRELESEADPTPQEPVPVVEAPDSAIGELAAWVDPFVKPVGTAFAVLVFTILLLLHRENMRERLIGLIGARRINLTTQAIGEASSRVSRYLFTQLVLNACFGIPFGIALYFIGVPNAMLWGLLATLLRFIPYAGVWIAVAMPAALAFAIADGWSQMVWVLGVFFALELVIVYAVEPWAYGRSTGLSPIAVIAAVLFWTWLWGPVGLLLAMPLTVCVAVMGRYVPEMGYLNVLLGVEPVLEPEARFYQRLVAMDQEEAEDIAEDYANEHGVAALHERVLIPALGLAEEDRHAGALDAERARFIIDTTRHIVEYVEERKFEPQAAVARGAPPVCVVAAHDEADHVSALALARVLPTAEFDARVVPFPLLAAETLDHIAGSGCCVVCISALPPRAAMHAGYLCKRLKLRFPELQVVVALWTSENIDKARLRLGEAGAAAVVTRIADAAGALRELCVPVQPPVNAPAPAPVSRAASS